VDITDLKAVLASAQSVFPQLYLMTDQPRTRRACLGLLLTDAPLAVPPARIDARLAGTRAVAADFERIGIDGLGILCQVTADRGLIELIAPREEALFDARPELGVRGALRSAGSSERLAVGLNIVALYRRDPMPWVDVGEEARTPVAAIVRDRYRSWQHLYAGALDVLREQGPAGTPFDREAPRATPLVEGDALLDALVGLPDWAYLRGLILGLSARLLREERYSDAERFLRRAVAKDTASAALRYALAGVVEQQGRKDEARELYRTVLAFEPGHSGALAAVEELDGG
jgi:tetratricopeptide (TPR) repeat protein